MLHGDDLVSVEASHLELAIEVAHRERHQFLVVDPALHQRRRYRPVGRRRRRLTRAGNDRGLSVSPGLPRKGSIRVLNLFLGENRSIINSATYLHSSSAIRYVRRPRTDSVIHARSRNVEHLVSEVVLVQVLGLQDVLNGQRDERENHTYHYQRYLFYHS